MTCIFCELPVERVVLESEYFNVIFDAYPVSEGHTLIIPKRHAETWFDLTVEEQHSAADLLNEIKKDLQVKDASILGFNIGMNCGEVAGQTVMHCHVHLIPRRNGDMDDPKGGVRGVIPGKQKY